MAFWLLELPNDEGGQNVKDGVFSVITEADDLATARSLASAQFDGDSDWGNATATALTALAVDYVGYIYKVKVSGDPAVPGAADVASVSYTAIASDLIDDIGAALVLLLNATPSIAASIYTGATDTLTVAAIADAIGDHSIEVEVIPPGGATGIPELVGTIVDEGIAAADLTVVLENPTAIPAAVQVSSVRL